MIGLGEAGERKGSDVSAVADAVFAWRSVFYPMTLVLVLLGTFLRLDGLFSPGFHSDEALYASWARLIAVWRDPLLSGQVVDKPPLLFYLQAILYPLMGTPAPWVARLPNVLASVLLLPLTARLVWQLYRDRLATMVAVLFMTLSPLAVRFAPTAFTDPLMTFFLLAALVAATRPTGTSVNDPGRHRLLGTQGLWAGVLFGLAVASKHQAILFLPLYFGVGTVMDWRRRMWQRMVVGFALVMLALIAWTVLRSDVPSPWVQQISAYGGLRLAWSWELWPRLEAWAGLWGTLLGSPLLSFGLILGLPLFLALLIQRQDWDTAWDQLFLLFIIAYMLLHWFVAVPIWSRYLVPLVPLTAVILGRFISRLLAFTVPEMPLARRWLPPASAALLLLLLLPPAVQNGETRHSAEKGASSVAARLADEPPGTVLYDHWYSWQWRYHLFDSGVYVSWFPHPQALAEDLKVFGRSGRRYVVLPHGPVADPVIRAVQSSGFEMKPVHAASEMTLYRIEPDGPQ